jgi:hypothetical protein
VWLPPGCLQPRKSGNRPNDYVGGAVITIPPLLAIIALSTTAHGRSAKRTKSEDEDEPEVAVMIAGAHVIAYIIGVGLAIASRRAGRPL